MTHQVIKTVNSFLSRDTPIRQGVDRLDLLSTNYLETSVYGGINSTMLVSIINALNGKKRIFILDGSWYGIFFNSSSEIPFSLSLR